jgi:hypothetical protein
MSEFIVVWVPRSNGSVEEAWEGGPALPFSFSFLFHFIFGMRVWWRQVKCFFSLEGRSDDDNDIFHEWID